MGKKVIFTDKAPMPFAAYSQAIKAQGLVFVAPAMPPLDPVTNQVVGTTIQEQTAQCLQQCRSGA